METEVYTIEPKNGSNIQELAKDGEVINLRNELGLPPLTLKDENSEFFRFRKMTVEENKVFSVLFPTKTPVENYSEFIPLEALQALKEFQDTCPYKICGHPMVWHAATYDPDPIIAVEVRTEKDQYDFADATILVARWGEALLPFELLRDKAAKVWRETMLTKLKQIKRQVERDLIDVEEDEFIGDTGNPHYAR